MQSINDFIKENNLKVEINFINGTYICHIQGKDGKFDFSMSREKVLEHMKRFCSKDFVEKMINDEKWVITHFRRLAVTWWYIQVVCDKTAKALNIN